MIGSDWTVGMEVVFLGPSSDAEGDCDPLQAGTIYVITDMHMTRMGDRAISGDGELFQLSEDAIYIKVGLPEWYYARCFRPVQKRATDISMFTAMLTGQKQGVDA